MRNLSKKKKRGCPTCEGVDAKSCCRCQGKTWMFLWFETDRGWAYYTELTADEHELADNL